MEFPSFDWKAVGRNVPWKREEDPELVLSAYGPFVSLAIVQESWSLINRLADHFYTPQTDSINYISGLAKSILLKTELYP